MPLRGKEEEEEEEKEEEDPVEKGSKGYFNYTVPQSAIVTP